jgi:4-hydroxybenzoyl-CoA reductase subunit beta
MQLPNFEHLEPASLGEALDLLAEHGEQAQVIAGGTDLLVSMKQRLLKPAQLVDLKTIPELDFIIGEEDGGLRIGTLAKLATIVNSSLIRERFPVLAQAAGMVAVPPLQNMGTLGGNLCLNTRCFYFNQSLFWRQARGPCYKTGGDTCHVVKDGNRCLATYQGDMAPVLIALDARARIARKGSERSVPLADLYTGKGKRPLVLEPGEMLLEVQVPASSSETRGDYQKLRYRGSMDFPLVGVAVVLSSEDGTVCTGGKVVLTAVSRGPLVVGEAPDMLQGHEVTEQTASEVAEAAYEVARPVDNVGSDAAYRRRMVRVLTRKAILNAWKRE